MKRLGDAIKGIGQAAALFRLTPPAIITALEETERERDRARAYSFMMAGSHPLDRLGRAFFEVALAHFSNLTGYPLHRLIREADLFILRIGSLTPAKDLDISLG